MKKLIFIVSLFITTVCYAQQWNSESDINNYYNRLISNKKQEIANAYSQLQNERGLLNSDSEGRRSVDEDFLRYKLLIPYLEDELRQLEAQRANQLNSFRQTQQRLREREEQNKRAQAQQQRRNRQQNQQAAAQRKRQHIDRRRQENEEIERRRDEENVRRELERQERIRREKQRLYNEGYDRSMSSSARSYERNMQTLNEMDNRMAEIRNHHQLDGIPRYSGYVSSGSSNITTKRSKAGILPKRGMSNFTIDPDKPFISLNMREGGSSRIYSEDFKWINPEQIIPVPSSGKEGKAWDKLRESCSEEKFLMLAHSLKTLNGGTIPSFQGYNDGNLVMYSPASEFDDTQKEKIFVVSPNGGRISYWEFENHDGKKENIFKRMEREEDLVDATGKLSVLGFEASAKKNDDISDDDNIGFRLGGKDFKIESKGEFAVSNTIPKGNIKGKITVVDNSLTISKKEVFINDYFAIEFGGIVTGGQKVSAEGKVYFDLNEKKAGVKADAGAELFSLGGNARVSFVKNTKGNTCIVSKEIKAEGDVKPSVMTLSRFFLDGSVDYESTITPINDLKKQIPTNNALRK